MLAIRIVVAALLGLAAVSIIAANWSAFYLGAIRGRNAPSWVPLLGGAAGSLAMIVSPLPSLRLWSWLPLVADWGTLPGLGHALLWHALHRRKS